MEAEIDSTDSVLPTLTDLFGEALLQRKFSTSINETTVSCSSIISNKNNLKDNSENVSNTTTPFLYQNTRALQQQSLIQHPVRRKRQREQSSPVLVKNMTTTTKFDNTMTNLRRQRAFTVNGPLSVSNLLTAKNPRNNIVTVIKNSNSNQRPVVRFAHLEEERTSSMMSHTTFVLENDQHKPLLVLSGFTEGYYKFHLNSM